MQTPYNLLGMVLGAHGGPYLSDFISESDTDLKSPDYDFNAGISVVLPAAVIVEFLNTEPMKKARAIKVEEAKKRSGFRPTSNSLPSSDENPSHKEDFNRLLNAAAKTPPQDDRT